MASVYIFSQLDPWQKPISNMIKRDLQPRVSLSKATFTWDSLVDAYNITRIT